MNCGYNYSGCGCNSYAPFVCNPFGCQGCNSGFGGCGCGSFGGCGCGGFGGGFGGCGGGSNWFAIVLVVFLLLIICGCARING